MIITHDHVVSTSRRTELAGRVTVSLCGWAINNAFWSDQITRYGPDPSEAVLYYPPLACSGIALFTAAVVAAWTALSSRKQVA